MHILEVEPPKFDWDHVFLLGWYTSDGKPRLTTWDGDLPYVRVVVTGPAGLRRWGPPIWKNYYNVKPDNFWGIVPVSVTDCVLHFVPPAQLSKVVARRIGGVAALGWYIEEGFQRGKE